MFACLATGDFFPARLDPIIDLRRPLAMLSSRIFWHCKRHLNSRSGAISTVHHLGVSPADYQKQITAVDRCHLKGEGGDRLHALLCAAGYNLKWLLRMMAKKGIAFLQRLSLRMCAMVIPPKSIWFRSRFKRPWPAAAWG